MTANQLVYVWDLATGQLVGNAQQRPFYVNGLGFSPTSPRTLAIASHAGTVSFYDVQTGAIGNPLRGHSARETALAYSGDGRYLATTAGDGLVGLWADTGGDGLVVHPTGADPVVAESFDGTRLLVLNGAQVEIRDASQPDQAGVPPQLPPGATASSGVNLNLSGYFSADGTTVLARTHDEPGVAFVADTRTGAVRWRLPPDEPGFMLGDVDVGLSSDGRFVAEPGYLAGQDFHDDFPGGLRIWDITSGRVVAETTSEKVAPGRRFTSAPRFTADGQYVDIGTGGGVARLRGSDLGVVAAASATPTSQVQCDLDEVPGTNDLVGGEQGGRIWRWDMSTGRLVASGKSHDTSSLCGVGVSPDGALIAAMHADLSVVLFDAATLRPIGQPIPTGSVFETARFTPDGKHLIGNGIFGSVEWDVAPDSWQAKACLAAGRNLTRAEWAEHLPGESYRASCPQWPPAP